MPYVDVTELLVDDGLVYVGGYDDFLVVEPTGEVRSLGFDGPRGRFVATDSHFYYLRPEGLTRRSRTSGMRELVVPLEAHAASHHIGGLGRAGIYVLQDGHSASTGKLLRVDPSSHAVATLASGLAGAAHGVVSGGYFYFTNTNAGTILRVRDE